MANNASAKKRIRQIQKRTLFNKDLHNRVKTYRKKTLEAIASGDKTTANTILPKLTSCVDICVKKNIFHRNKAANIKSKLAKAIKALA